MNHFRQGRSWVRTDSSTDASAQRSGQPRCLPPHRGSGHQLLDSNQLRREEVCAEEKTGHRAVSDCEGGWGHALELGHGAGGRAGRSQDLAPVGWQNCLRQSRKLVT